MGGSIAAARAEAADGVAVALDALIAAHTSVAGVGVDIEPMASFETLPFEAHRHEYERMFTSDEIAYCRRRALPAQHFAARWAAKEAVVKAIGERFALLPSDVEIVRSGSGTPSARLLSPSAAGLDARLRISIGHADGLAYAVALLLESGTGV